MPLPVTIPAGVLFAAFLGSLVALGVVVLLAFLLRRRLLDRVVDRSLRRLLKDPYSENLWDLAISMTRVPPHVLFETELRAETGRLVERPLGGLVRVSDWSGIAFNPAQLARLPLPPGTPVDTSTVIGPRCPRPLRLDLPILVGAMSFGIGVSKAFALALARGAKQAGTAYNAGSGPVLPEVTAAAGRLILQYTGGAWNRDPRTLAGADMIEIRLGHGARCALGRVISAGRLPPEAREAMGVAEGDRIVLEAPVPGASNPDELRALVQWLRELTGGRPVGVKIAATHDLERELAIVLAAGVDVIAIDGSEGGTRQSPPVIADDFGLPTLHALVRAVEFLEASGARGRVSLIAGGGLRSPAEMLKALALGADAVYVATTVMMACIHGQLSKATPFEPITQLVFATGQKAGALDPDQGARHVANFLRACAEEMAEAARALGKRSLREITRDDLVARTPQAAALLGLPPSWRSRGTGKLVTSPVSAASGGPVKNPVPGAPAAPRPGRRHRKRYRRRPE